jgi:hypothetical protein
MNKYGTNVISHRSTCRHLRRFNTDAHVGMIKTGGIWVKSCSSCVAFFVGKSLKRGEDSVNIAKCLDFHCCNHAKPPMAGCRACLTSVKQILRYVWCYHEPQEVIHLLGKSIKPPAKNSRLNRGPSSGNLGKQQRRLSHGLE